MIVASFVARGCRSQCDLVEAELRTKERQLREMEEELCKTRLFNEGLHNELRAIRPHAGTSMTPEQASQTYTLKEIVLGRTTGGRDEDGIPGDESLHVMLEPRDPDGHPIKVPGSVRIETMQINADGLKSPLCYWEIAPTQLRCHWRSGLFANGYELDLPWKVYPSASKVRVTARMILADGRVFETDKDVTVRTGNALLPKTGSLGSPDRMNIVAPDEPTLPFPKSTPSAPLSGPELQPASSLNQNHLDSGGWQRQTHHSTQRVHLHRPEPVR